jgi:hypothetical protein
MQVPIGRTRARTFPRVAGVVAAAWLVIASGAAAAFPASAAAPSVPPSLASVEAWLDADFITPDAPPGGHLTAGVTFWDTATHDVATVDGLVATLTPRTGHAKPGGGTITVDFPGHVTIELLVPTGGPGSLALAVHTATGDVPLPIKGTGPPPDAPLEQLLMVTYHAFVGSLVAGRPFPVTAEVVGRGQWDVSTLQVPTEVTVVATQAGKEVATGLLDNTGGPGLPYTGHVTIPDTGDATLTIALHQPDGSETPIPGSDKVVTLIEGGRPSPSAAPVAAAPEPEADAGINPVVWLLAALGLVLAVALIAGPALRRRRRS